MKKIIWLLLFGFLLTGCGTDMTNTPTRQTEIFFEKYQMLDDDVVTDLTNVAAQDENFNTDQRETYIEIMSNHYQSLKYTIKDEVIDGDTAIVTVEITVTDHYKVINESNEYLSLNPDEFNEEGIYSHKLFVDYQLDAFKNNTATVVYTLNIDLTKVEDEWNIDELSQTELDKINGMYNY
ncbi:MAG: hypothetical protein R3Y21_01685 [Mycoplasmatota bacterium]